MLPDRGEQRSALMKVCEVFAMIVLQRDEMRRMDFGVHGFEVFMKRHVDMGAIGTRA